MTVNMSLEKLPENVLKEINELKKDLKEKGFMDPVLGDTYKTSVMMFILFISSFVLLYIGQNNLFLLIFSAILMGLFYLRMGFFAHDLLHGQIIRISSVKSKIINDLIVSFGQGLSSSWWRKKHGAHHMYPNAYKKNDNEIKTLDGDIDTLPILCWSKDLMTEKQKNSVLLNKWIKIQRFAFWPILSVLRFVWISQSFNEGDKYEKIGIVLHHVFIFAVAMFVFDISLLNTIIWLFLANWIGGFAVGLFSLISHSGLEIYEQKTNLDQVSSVIRTTRNLKYNPILFWLSGGLSNQIEHHLFATMTRNKLVPTSKKIKEILEKNNLSYNEVGFFEALKIMHNSLKV